MLVRQRTSLKLFMQQICINQTGSRLTNNFIEQMDNKEICKIFEEEEWQLNCASLFLTLKLIKKEINKHELEPDG